MGGLGAGQHLQAAPAAADPACGCACVAASCLCVMPLSHPLCAGQDARQRTTHPWLALQVTNNGLSHGESVPTARVGQLVQDALDAIEYIMGPSDSVWGARRAAAGHPAPWKMSYLGIGNEVPAPQRWSS